MKIQYWQDNIICKKYNNDIILGEYHYIINGRSCLQHMDIVLEYHI